MPLWQTNRKYITSSWWFSSYLKFQSEICPLAISLIHVAAFRVEWKWMVLHKYTTKKWERKEKKLSTQVSRFSNNQENECREEVSRARKEMRKTEIFFFSFFVAIKWNVKMRKNYICRWFYVYIMHI